MPLTPVTPAGIVLPPRRGAAQGLDPTAAELVGIGHVAPDPGWRMSEHAHPMHELIVVVRGRLIVRLAGTVDEIEAGPGDALWYRAGRAHAERTVAGDAVESYFIALRWPGVDSADDSAWPARRHDRSGFIRQQAAWLYAARDDAGPFAAAKREALLRALLAGFAALAHRSPDGEDLVARVRARMRADLDAPLTLDDLARAAGLSRSYFVRAFKRLAGRTPMDELRRLRLERACDLLLGTDLGLRAIAERCGLGSEFLLSRQFRRSFGMPPGAFRVARVAAATTDKRRQGGH